MLRTTYTITEAGPGTRTTRHIFRETASGTAAWCGNSGTGTGYTTVSKSTLREHIADGDMCKLCVRNAGLDSMESMASD